MKNFKPNMQRVLKNYQNKTQELKVKGVEQWYTSAKNVSRGYAMLYKLYMDETKRSMLIEMSAEEIWRSHLEFQKYELDKFKGYNTKMRALTENRLCRISEEEACFKRDVQKWPHHTVTSRGVPFWNTHAASKLLKDQIAKEMSGQTQKLQPVDLWRSRVEYQAFPLPIFRKHIYQERMKQLSAPYWQHKRNEAAEKKYQEVQSMFKEWEEDQLDIDIENLRMQYSQMSAHEE